jgi:hypothetical protein
MQKIILTTVPTGLGHIRVTKALAKGLPTPIQPTILGVQDETTAMLYRIISTNFYLRWLLEFTQTNPIVERTSTEILNFIQTSDTQGTEIMLKGFIGDDPKVKIIIVSTHAFIAQKIQKIINNKTIPNPIFHAVIITDDSPQRFWMVDADMIFAPSHYTKNTLEKLYKKDNRQVPLIKVNPYPINPEFCEKLRPEVLYNKIEQLHPENPQKARICIPVSGAAVQLNYYTTLIEELLAQDTKNQNREFTFSIVTRKGNYTRPFISHFREELEVSFHIGANDEQTVELYDQLYHQPNPPAIEITKPSEQAFKALTTPDTIGGPLLLLTDPVGRQEYDNLNFLERHSLMPSPHEHLELLEAFMSDNKEKLENMREMAHTWRCLRLPSNPHEASQFIVNGFKHGIFIAMQDYRRYTHTDELSPDGVKQIWETILN